MRKSTKLETETARLSFGTAARISLVFIVLCGIVYPLVCTGLAQTLFPGRANGSLIQNGEGEVVGSELIGQPFTDPKYFHGRVSSIEYKAEASGTNNYAPSHPELLKRMQESIERWKKNNPDVPVSRLPIDLITNSGSGLDPHITPASAQAQAPRVAKLRGLSVSQIEELIDANTEGRDLGLFGEPRVNVLKLNLALDGLHP
ncbi:Potassium-transporting ATPase KdpC subunit [Paenibacillus solanacearum]|uniref:Potassium-transporting ATPase KdpC subunit n=1 Tax=Paenibacillus solanacearum TaxID=2048548 RepID=A0A916K7E2_9BACL|nr:potassium-transporting ATPase subunit KdpC [Paenibacillus solanacearum]CAG7640679.1 Potassium-transporting ATPase KdpC subunit [Paenibacillus solanacearum]